MSFTMLVTRLHLVQGRQQLLQLALARYVLSEPDTAHLMLQSSHLICFLSSIMRSLTLLARYHGLQWSDQARPAALLITENWSSTLTTR